MLCALILSLTACGGTGMPAVTDTPAPAPLEGTQWLLVSLNGRDPLPDTTFSLDFKDGQATGVSGCNSYGGTYTAAGGRLTLGELASTVMLCTEPPGVMDQEKAFLDALRGASVYRLSGDRLEIATTLGDKTLTFAAKPRFDVDPADLPGTRWQLVSIDGQAPGARPPITLLFDPVTGTGGAGQVSGYAGCRSYRATYQAEGDSIVFPLLEMAGPDCSDPAALTLEGRYTDALQSATNYRLAEGRLELLTTREGVLIFETLP
jgi:heat shock protein HslJ